MGWIGESGVWATHTGCGLLLLTSASCKAQGHAMLMTLSFPLDHRGFMIR